MKTPALSPYLPGFEYIPDGEPHVFDGRVYIFCSHDRFGGDKFCMENYVCWSAPVDDLGAWRFEGDIYDKMRDQPDRLLFALDVCRGPDGRYYLYYAFDFEGIISAAVCDTPAGKYEFYGHVHWPDGQVLGRRPGNPFLFDPAVLADADGSVYLYSGLCRPGKPRTGRMPAGIVYPPDEGPMGVKLGPDMLTVVSDRHFVVPCWRTSAGTGYEGLEFFEAPSVRHAGDTYYFIYSSLQGHELCWGRSASPLGPFAFGGVLVSNGDIGLHGRTADTPVTYTGNNHGSIVEIGGKWHVFYHRQTNRRQFSRQGCAEEISILPNGFIPQVEITSCGLNGGPLPGEGTVRVRTSPNGGDIAQIPVTPSADWAPRSASLASPGGVCPLYFIFDVKCSSDLLKIALRRENQEKA